MSHAPEPSDPVLRLVVDRALAGSRAGERSDGARIALAIEGGGMAGAVSGGMCSALEAWGLIDSFDVIYGSSAGALNASYTAARQAQQRLGLYEQAARERLIDPRRLMLRRPAFQPGEIFGSLLRRHPHAPDVLDKAARFRVVATHVEDKAPETFGEFASLDELRAVLRASCSTPGITGDVVELRGRRFVDGALSETIPFGVALREGATHVLVLRSRPADHRHPELRGIRRRVVDRLVGEAPATVVELCHEFPARYNAEASVLQAPERAGLAGRVAQLAPPAGAPLARMLESRPRCVRAATAQGARTVHRALAAQADVAAQLVPPARPSVPALAYAR